MAIGFSLWILPLIAVGAFLVPAYNLELFGGRFHSDLWFALAWGAFPVVTGAVAVAGTVRAATVIAAVWATVLSLAQRRLSTPVRRSRREVVSVTGELELAGGSREAVRGRRSSRHPRQWRGPPSRGAHPRVWPRHDPHRIGFGARRGPAAGR